MQGAVRPACHFAGRRADRPAHNFAVYIQGRSAMHSLYDAQGCPPWAQFCCFQGWPPCVVKGEEIVTSRKKYTAITHVKPLNISEWWITIFVIQKYTFTLWRINYERLIISTPLILRLSLLEIRRGENRRSQNRTSKTGWGAAETGFASPILGPEIEQSLIYY